MVTQKVGMRGMGCLPPGGTGRSSGRICQRGGPLSDHSRAVRRAAPVSAVICSQVEYIWKEKTATSTTDTSIILMRTNLRRSCLSMVCPPFVGIGYIHYIESAEKGKSFPQSFPPERALGDAKKFF